MVRNTRTELTLALSILPTMADFSPNVSEQVVSFSRAVLSQDTKLLQESWYVVCWATFSSALASMSCGNKHSLINSLPFFTVITSIFEIARNKIIRCFENTDRPENRFTENKKAVSLRMKKPLLIENEKGHH